MRLAAVLLAAAGLMCVSAAAQEDDQQDAGQARGMGHNMPAFADVDANGDGSIVAEELYAMRARHMAERAKQGGKLRNAGNAPSFEAIDTDGDGKVSPEEFAAHQAQMQEQHRGAQQ